MTVVYYNDRFSVGRLINLGCDVNIQLWTPSGKRKNKFVSEPYGNSSLETVLIRTAVCTLFRKDTQH